MVGFKVEICKILRQFALFTKCHTNSIKSETCLLRNKTPILLKISRN